jgi:hypothetical protein
LPPDLRPFRLKSGDDLQASFQCALAKADGVTGAHCIHERWMRGDFAAHIEADLDLLWKSAAPSIPDWLPMRYVSWLPAAYEAAAGFAATGRRLRAQARLGSACRSDSASAEHPTQ